MSYHIHLKLKKTLKILPEHVGSAIWLKKKSDGNKEYFFPLEVGIVDIQEPRELILYFT